MTRIIPVLILFFCFTSFMPLSCKTRLSKKVHCVAKIRENVAITLAKRHNIKIDNLGANMRDKVSLIYIDFEVPNKLTQNECRRLIMGCVDELIEQVNACTEIQPYLENRPFGPENVAIFFVINDGKKRVNHPEFAHIGFNRGELYYKTRNLRQQRGYIQEIRETFDEAKRKIQEENS